MIKIVAENYIKDRQVRQTLIWLFLMNVGLTIWEMT